MSDPPESRLPPAPPRLGPLAHLSLRAAPWLAALAMAVLWRKDRRRGAAPDAGEAPLTPEDFEAAEPGRGRAANYPWMIPPRGWKDILWRTYRKYGRTRLPALAGGVTFYLLLATFPAIAAFVSLYGLFSSVDSVEQQLQHMSSILPREAVRLIGAEMLRLARERQGTLGVAFVGSALISIWSANAGMKALFDGVNIAYNEVEKRPYLPRTLLTYAATLGALVFAVAITAMGVAVPMAFQQIGLSGSAHGWVPLRWIAIYLTAALAFSLVYRFGASRRRPRWRWVAGGGLAAALLWMAGSLGFSWYLNTFTHLGVTYGSLGAMIGFMLWVWFSVMVVLVGAELTAEIEHQTARDTTIGAPRPIGERGAVMADTIGEAFTVSPRQGRDLATAFLARQIGYVIDFLRRLGRPKRLTRTPPPGSPAARPGPRR